MLLEMSLRGVFRLLKEFIFSIIFYIRQTHHFKSNYLISFECIIDGHAYPLINLKLEGNHHNDINACKIGLNGNQQ